MAGKRKPPLDDAVPAEVPRPPATHLIRTAFKFTLAIAMAGVVLAALVWVGREAGLGVVGRDRYAVRVADIVCDSPPGTERTAFLTEVRYLSDLPETVQAVDPTLSDRLTAAFQKHPWVAEITGVVVEPDRRIRVNLRLRVPVLAVTVEGESRKRAVDATAVLLPTTTATDALAEFANPVLPPTRPAGEVWPDPDVKRAAELVIQHDAVRVEKLPDEWRITRRGGQVLRVNVFSTPPKGP